MPVAFHTDAGVEWLFADAGFNDVRTDTVLLNVPIDDLEQWRSWSMATAMRALVGRPSGRAAPGGARTGR